jgi:protein phosphatase
VRSALDAVHADKDHVWHMNTIGSFVQEGDGPLMRTPYHVVDLADPASEATATAWWENLTEAGGEGAVVKPLQFVATTSRGLLQPAVKCRGREYLRIIYGPEYTLSAFANTGSQASGRWRFASLRWESKGSSDSFNASP